MKYETQILGILKENNIVTTQDLKKRNIPKVILTRLIKKGKLERVKRGVYINPNSIGDEYYTLLYGTENAIYSYFTALYFHNLCERVPLCYDVTVKSSYGGALQKSKNTNLHYVNEEIFNLGKIKIKSPQGQMVNCYDVERCLCDLIKDKDNLYFEYVKYAFVEYYRNQKHDTFKLYKYAKIMGIEDKVYEFMGVLL